MGFDFEKEIILEDKRVLIRPMEEADKEFFIEFLLDQQLNRYSAFAVENAKSAIQYVDSCLADRQAKQRYPFVFYDKKFNGLAGTSCYGNVSNQHERLEIGWTKIGKDFQGTGLNLHVKRLMLAYAFETLQFNRVEFKSHSENIPSRKAMEKIGAKYEGLLRQHMIMPDQSLRDTVYYSIIKREWAMTSAMISSLEGY